MVGGVALLTLNDAVLKWLTTDFPIGQVLFFRGIFVFPLVAVLVWRAGSVRALAIHGGRAQCLRAALVIASTFLFVTGLSLLPLADAIAVTLAGPLFITALARPLLGERVGWRRWSAVAAGFSGVLVMVRPTGDALQWAVLFPLAATFCGALRDIVTRRMCRTESTLAILGFSTLAVVLAGLGTLPFGWQPLGAVDVALFALAGLFLGGAHYLLIEAFRLAEAALVAPFKYSNMVWAVLFGFLIWGDLPDRWMIAGATVVVSSGLYILRRETRSRRP